MSSMMGFLLSQKECRELNYVLRKEMEEMLLDLEDSRISDVVKRAMEERYHVIFKIFARVATPQEISQYMRTRQLH